MRERSIIIIGLLFTFLLINQASCQDFEETEAYTTEHDIPEQTTKVYEFYPTENYITADNGQTSAEEEQRFTDADTTIDSISGDTTINIYQETSSGDADVVEITTVQLTTDAAKTTLTAAIEEVDAKTSTVPIVHGFLPEKLLSVSINQNSPIIKKLGETVEVECTPSSQDSDIIARIFNTQNDILSEGNPAKMSIRAAQASHAGNYRCEAVQTSGTASASVEFAIQIDEPEIKTEELFTGDSTELDGPNLDGVFWEKEGAEGFSRDNIDSSKASTVDGKLRLQNVEPRHSGEYRSTDSSGNVYSRYSIRVTNKVMAHQPCAIDQGTCRNLECIPRSGFCDGVRDCSDGSDESNCGGQNKERCEPNEKACANGKCIQKFWFCDGDNDCDDGSDEDLSICVDDKRFPAPGTCRSREFKCQTIDKCIPKGFVCDGESDCEDGSDEMGCIKPTIMKGPQRNVTVGLGQRMVIECIAIGFPAPFINWRHNWGHVCEPPRCFSTNDGNGKGTFTITDTRVEDSGAYSCEAINSQGSTFAIPDAILTVIITERPKDCFCNNLNDAYCEFSVLAYNTYSANFRFDAWTVQNEINGLFGTLRPLSDSEIEFTNSDIDSSEFAFIASKKFLGNKLTSYGGNLVFTISFESLVSNADSRAEVEINLEGYQIAMRYSHPVQLLSNQQHKIAVPIIESSFKRIGDEHSINRVHMLLALAKVNVLSIKLRTELSQYKIILKDVSIDEAVEKRRAEQPLRIAHQVEVCSCPPGYTGSSCENCAPGYEKVGGVYWGTCEKIAVYCFCNGFSDICDEQGRCMSCSGNRVGDNCERCAPGFVMRNNNCELDVVITIQTTSVQLEQNQNFTVYVTIHGGVQPTKSTWTKQGSQRLPYNVVQQGNNLVIISANRQMTGNYVFTVYTVYGVVTKIIYVKVTDGQPPRIIVPKEEIHELEGTIGQPFNFECHATGIPTPSIHINTPRGSQKSDAAPSIGPFPTSATRNVAKFEIGSFTEENTGEYTCIASNMYGTVSKRIVVNARKPAVPPKVVVNPKRIEALEGDNLAIEASYIVPAYLNDHVLLSWTRVKLHLQEHPPKSEK